MIGFWDNDVLHKLAALDLIAEGLGSLPPLDGAVVLPTARFKFLCKRPVEGKRKYGEDTFDRIHRFISKCRATPREASETDSKLFGGIVGIDQGEAILFSMSAGYLDSLLLTGDKRSLIALSSAPACLEVTARLQGRVVCFERLMLQIVSAGGFADAKEKIVRSLATDTVLRSAFGSGAATSESAAVDALEAYLLNLKQQTGSLLWEP